MKHFACEAFKKEMRLRVDFNNMMSGFVKGGITPEELEANAAAYEAAARAMDEKRGSMKWRELPFNQDEVIKAINAKAKDIRDNFDDFVVLGIGGSALGPIAVHQALCHLRYNDLPRERRGGPRLFIEDNIDPERMESLFEVIDVERTMFNVITKSGSTSETMSQLLLVTNILREKLGDGWTEHIVATTDHSKGNLIKISKEFGLDTFYVPDGVGGRFSELCPVGLLAAAVCGIDIEELLAGAAYMDELCRTHDIWHNPAYMMAALQMKAVEKGLKGDAAAQTKALLAEKQPLEVVDEALIPALDIVGAKYEKGTLFLPQLLQAASAAQSAFEEIKNVIAQKGEGSASKGRIVLATVKGDVHDIGKNIVKVILENYGFEVIDLGRDVPVETVVDTVREKNVHLVGLSALMTTTLKSMEETIAALHEAGLDCKIMVGGAVLTPEYAEKIGADWYAKDAKRSADIAKEFFGV